MTKIDPHKLGQKYTNWLNKVAPKQGNVRVSAGIPGLNDENSKLILMHLEDMESGVNVSPGSCKGGRSYARLIIIRDKLLAMSKFVQERYGEEKVLTSLTAPELLRLFHSLRKGETVGPGGQALKDTDTIANTFAAFWHWWQRVNRDKQIPDITLDLNKNHDNKAPWTYLTEEEFVTLAEACNPWYRAMLYLMYDAGCRAPTELSNIRACDITTDNGAFYLNIREEASKTFGRRIRLMISGKIVQEHMHREKIEPDSEQALFLVQSGTANKYLKRIAFDLFGNRMTKGRKRCNEISIYHIRHNSACYWVRRYKNHSQLMYRFGWKREDMIEHYTEFLGHKDEIQPEDMIVDVSATEIQRDLIQKNSKIERLEDQVKSLKADFDDFKLRVLLLMEAGIRWEGTERKGAAAQITTFVSENGRIRELLPDESRKLLDHDNSDNM